MPPARLKSVLLCVLLVSFSVAPARGQNSEGIRNWNAPSFWKTDSPSSAVDGGVAAKATLASTSPLPFVGITPCRVADTRGNGFSGEYGQPSMSPSMPRDFTIAGQCEIPVDAAAVSFNFTVVRTQGLGHLHLYAEGTVRGPSTLNYIAGQIVANNAVVGLGSGAITAEVVGQGTDLIIDVNGYYGGFIGTSLNGVSGDVTLEAGDNITIAPSGAAFTISATALTGPPGPPGPAGARGPQGIAGATGAMGPQGATGAAGPQGATCDTGPAGSSGPGFIFQTYHILDSSGITTAYLSPITTSNLINNADWSATESFEVTAIVPNACTMTKIVMSSSALLPASTVRLRMGASAGSMADTSLECSAAATDFQRSAAGSVSVSAMSFIDVMILVPGAASGTLRPLVVLSCQ